jgi:hypothetical protein
MRINLHEVLVRGLVDLWLSWGPYAQILMKMAACAMTQRRNELVAEDRKPCSYRQIRVKAGQSAIASIE